MNRLITSRICSSALLVILATVFLAEPAVGQVKGLIHIGVTGSSFRGGSLENASPIYRFLGWRRCAVRISKWLRTRIGTGLHGQGGRVGGLVRGTPHHRRLRDHVPQRTGSARIPVQSDRPIPTSGRCGPIDVLQDRRSHQLSGRGW